jgi:hypothetical protein
MHSSIGAGIDRFDREVILSAFHTDAIDELGKFVGKFAEFVGSRTTPGWAAEIEAPGGRAKRTGIAAIGGSPTLAAARLDRQRQAEWCEPFPLGRTRLKFTLVAQPTK